MAALAQTSKVLLFQPKQDYCPYEHYQTSSERQVYSKMYQQTQRGTISRRFTLDGLKFDTGFKSQDTIRVALAGLVRKGHVTILDKKGCRHYGILYRVQMPPEIRALNQDLKYLAEQERLAAEAKSQKPKAKQLKLHLVFDAPDHAMGAGENPVDATPVVPATTAAPVAAVEPLAEAPNPVEIPAIRVTESTPIDEPENLKIRVTETQNLGSQKALILLLVLKHVLHMGNLAGGSGSPMCACMREAAPGALAAPSAAAPEPPVAAAPVPPPAQSEGDSRHRMPRATGSPETTDLGKALLVMLMWTDIALDQRLKAELRRGYAWFTANHATPEEILRYKVWWWESGRTRPPKLDWMIENFPVFRGESAAPEAPGTAARSAPTAPIKFPTKASYETIAAQMRQTYTGKHWESISEKMAVFKGYVLRAGVAWNDDLANEIIY